MSLTRKILSNTFWQVFGRLAASVLGVISIKIITNYLPTEIYGQYTTLYEFIGFFAIAADFGLYTIGVREMAKKEKTEEFILSNILSVRLILILFTLASATVVVQFIPKYNGTYISAGIFVVALTTALALLNGTISSILQYRLKMLYASIALTISKFIAVGYIAFAVFYLHPSNLEQGFYHLLYSGIIANLFLIGITYYFVSRETNIRLGFDKKYILSLVRQSLPYGMALILSTVYFKLDIILLSLIKDYHQVGIYGVPLKLMEILSVLPVFFMNSTIASLTEKFRKNIDDFKSALSRSWNFLFLMATPLLIGGVVLAFPLTFVISNPQFLSGYHCINDIRIVHQDSVIAAENCPTVKHSDEFSWQQSDNVSAPQSYKATKLPSYIYLQGSDSALKIILLGMFFSYLNTLFTFTLVAIDQQSKLLIINGIGVIFNFITNLIFIPKYGFMGAAVTTALSEIIILAGTYYYLRKRVKFNIPIKKSFAIILAGLTMGASIYALEPIFYGFVQNYSILLLVPLGGIIYAGALLIFKAFPHDELKRILKRA